MTNSQALSISKTGKESHFLDKVIKKGMEAATSEKSKASSVYDTHTQPHHELTLSQLTLFIIYVGMIAVYVLRWSTRTFKAQKNGDVEKLNNSVTANSHVVVVKNGIGNEHIETQKQPKSEQSTVSTPAVPSFDDFLKYFILFGAIMIYFFLCDYVKVFPAEPRVYDRDTFLFLVFILFLVASAFTITPTKDAILSRDQTEEWKGWMQVMFVWYHYFAAKEWYNWIRIYIACYVWMTGFGNFSFFWVRKDYSLWRVFKMLFRLNFLVIFVALTTNNEYMLYYICAMHTYWFITVFVFMRVLNSWNEDRFKMAAKFAVYILCNAVMFEIPGLCSTLFRPLWFVFGLHDSRFDIMHEWEFRAGLDHWACLVGMLCAYNYPHFETFIRWLEKETNSRKDHIVQLIIKVVLIITAIAVGLIWYFVFMTKQKYDYNKSHPYSSIIPILIFIILRNSFPVLRRYHVHLFAWLGKITLETYLSQLHVYLQSNAKELIGYLVKEPLLNFSLASIIYLVISYLLFHITVEFSAFLIPKSIKTVMKNVITVVVVVAVSVALAVGIRFSDARVAHQ